MPQCGARPGTSTDNEISASEDEGDEAKFPTTSSYTISNITPAQSVAVGDAGATAGLSRIETRPTMANNADSKSLTKAVAGEKVAEPRPGNDIVADESVEVQTKL